MYSFGDVNNYTTRKYLYMTRPSTPTRRYGGRDKYLFGNGNAPCTTTDARKTTKFHYFPRRPRVQLRCQDGPDKYHDDPNDYR